MRVLYLSILLCVGLIGVCLLPAEADNGYVNPKLPNFGCPILSGLKGEEIMIRNMMQSVHNYKIRCPTVSGSQVNLTWEPNATQEVTQSYTYNSSLPFHVLSPNGTEVRYAVEAGQSADIPIGFNLTKGYKMSYVSLSLSDVPQNARIFINPNVSDYFSNQLDKDSVANGTLHVYVDSATTPGNYNVAIIGKGSVNDPSGKEVDIKNSVGTFHLDVLPSTNKVWLKVGTPTVHQVIILTKLGSSTMASGFGGETDVPITVYASQKTPVTLGVDQYPQDAFYKFVPDMFVATSQGTNVTMIMAGAGVPNPYAPNAMHTDVAKIIATSQYGNSTAAGFLPVFKGDKITILHGPQPINLTSSSFGGNSFFGFKIIGVIYDPPVESSGTMAVHLSILGTMNGTKILPIPSWLKVAFPIPAFTLDADKPYYFVLNFTTQHGFEEPYPVAINENVGGSNFTQVVWLPKESHIVFGGMPRQMSPLKQIQSGNKSKDMTCHVGLQLIIKAEDGTLACVRPDTAQKLMERGWTREVITSNLDVNSSCDGTAILSPNYHAMLFPVLLMQPNATSCVKLTYTVIRPYGVIQDGVNWPRNETIQFHISDLNYEGDANSFGITQGKDYTNSFSITAFPKTIDHANYPVGSNFTVTYLIRPLPNATGFYDQSIPTPMCFYYPLAVGHSAKEVNSSDFSKGMVTMLSHSCMRGEDELVGVQVRGMSYTEMKLP